MAAQREWFEKNYYEVLGVPEGASQKDITKAYRVYFSKADENEDDDDDYLVDHSIVMYLIGPDGEFLDFFTQSARVDDIVKKIKAHF